MTVPARGHDPGAGPVTPQGPSRATRQETPPTKRNERVHPARVDGSARRRLPARLPAVPPGLQGLAALIIYLVTWILAVALPLVAHPGNPQLDQASMDPNFYTWNLRWWPYAIGHGLNPLHATLIGVPHGFTLAWVTSVPPLALLAAPITLTAGPVASFNLLTAAALPVSAWAAFLLCRRLTGRPWPALAGGAVYGFSAYQINHEVAGQLNLTWSLLLPLMAYLVVAWRDGSIGGGRLVCLLALAMIVQFYLFLETFADMTAVWAVALAAGYLVAGRPGRAAVAQLSRLAGAAYLVTLVFVGPYLWYAATHVPRGFSRSPASTGLDLSSLVVPRPTQTFGLSWLARQSAGIPIPSLDGYVGVPLLVLAVALAVTSWSRRTVRFLTVMLIALGVLALGPVATLGRRRIGSLPWAHLWYLPIVRSAYPVRFMVFAFLALAVAVSIWLASAPVRASARWLLGVLAVAAVLANVPALPLAHQPGSPRFITTGEYRRYLSPGEVVVVASGRGNAGMLWQAQTGFYTRLAGGFVNRAIVHRTDLPQPVANLAGGPNPLVVAQFRQFLARARVGAILVEQRWPQQWPRIFASLGLHPVRAGGVIVYRIPSLRTSGHARRG
jgi:hypothetical protein